MSRPGFRKGQFDTSFIERNLVDLGAVPKGIDRAAVALGAQTVLAQQRDRLAALPVRTGATGLTMG